MITLINFYGWPFLIGLAITSGLCYLIVKFQSIFVLHDKRCGNRHIHRRQISRFGGVAIISGFVGALIVNKYLFFDHIVWSMIVGGGIILLFGIIDDIKIISWKSQFLAQIVVILLVFIMGVRIDILTNPFNSVTWFIYDKLPLASLLLTFIWIGIIMNAINWSDGIDGLAGGIVFIAAITLFIISLQPNVYQPPMAIISIVLAGSIVGFLIFNLPSAYIFAGSSGSFFMGFIVAVIAIAAGAKIGTTILVLAVPLIDAMWVIGERFRRGKSIFQSDKKHLHHKLLDFGWSTWQILFLYYTITIICAIMAIFTHNVSKFVVFFVFCGGVIIFFIALSHKIQQNKMIRNI